MSRIIDERFTDIVSFESTHLPHITYKPFPYRTLNARLKLAGDDYQTKFLLIFFFYKKSQHMPTYPTITNMGISRWGHMLGIRGVKNIKIKEIYRLPNTRRSKEWLPPGLLPFCQFQRFLIFFRQLSPRFFGLQISSRQSSPQFFRLLIFSRQLSPQFFCSLIFSRQLSPSLRKSQLK